MDSTIDDSAAAAPALRPGDDLSAIAWVHEELRRSLDAAHKSLRRFLKDTEVVTGSDIDSVDPGVLRAARAQIHQGRRRARAGRPAGGGDRPARRRDGGAAARRSRRSLTPELVATSSALVRLLDYLLGSSRQAGLAMSLFPQYRAVRKPSRRARAPGDLWPVDWRWREVASDPRVVRASRRRTCASSSSTTASLMRGKGATAREPRDCDLGPGSSTHPQVALLEPAAAMFEAQHHGLLGFDVFTKRVASRLLAQFRILQRGDSDVSERLARDVLFFCAQAAPAPATVRLPRMAAARTAYGLPDETPTDYGTSVLGRFDPAMVAHAKKRVVAAKEAWSATAGGEMHRLAGLAEQFALVGDSLRKLFPFGEAFAAELQAAVVQTQQAQAAPHRRWRWKSRPASSIWKPHSRTTTSTSPSMPIGCVASAYAWRACAPGSRPSRSSRGWRSSTGESPTGRRWAAWCRSCAPR
jgi:chemosensory pili system protein ChpA (sensor histidine kinase/response regulator)